MAHDSQSTRTVETTVQLDAEPRRVIRAFLEGADLKEWWRVTRSLVEAKPGGTWCIAWDDFGENKTNHSWMGVIRELDKRQLVIDPLVLNEPNRPILFGPLRLEVLAEAADDGTKLTVLHHGYQHGEHWDWLYGVVVQGWKQVLADMTDWFGRRNWRKGI